MISTILILVMALEGLSEAKVDLEKLCLDFSSGEVLPHPLDCRGYIVCKDQPSEEYCELGFHFDKLRKVCNWPENANCQLPPESKETNEESSLKSHSASPLLALDILTGEIVDPLLGYEPSNVMCRHFGAYFLPNPKQCQSYFLCAYGHMHELSCAPGTLWDYGKQKCSLNYKAKCYRRSKEEDQEINTLLAPNNGHPSQVCYPLEENSNITTAVTSTPTTEKFHPTGSSYTRTTVLSTQPVTPSSRPPTTKKPTHITTTTTSKPFEIICPAKRQSYVAHPRDCTKYYMCIMGTPVLTGCPLGLFWDAKREYCDFEENVKCFSTKKSKV